MVALIAAGFALRIWNARTAYIHDDEVHYVEDAAWSYSGLSSHESIGFLRNHPREHLRLDPQTRELQPWGQHGLYPRLGHPPLYAVILGALFRIDPPSSTEDAVMRGRFLNAVADSLTIILLPFLAVGAGAPLTTGVVSAALYALYPPAVTYGSLAYLDPFLAPLFVAVLVVLVKGNPASRRTWIVAGALTGLLVTTKQTGLLALLVVPLVAACRGMLRARGTLTWLLAAGAVVFLLTNPIGYVEALFDPLDPYARLRTSALDTFVSNATFLARAYDYYWLSYARHGRPLATVLAPLHHTLTPPVLLLFALSALWIIRSRRWSYVVFLHLPILVALCLLPPSDGAWRAHIIAPLVCLAAAIPPTHGRLWMRLAAISAAVTVAVFPALPATPARFGMADLLRANHAIAAVQPYSVFDPFKGRPLMIHVEPALELRRRLWIMPGLYDVGFSSDVWTIISLDGEVVLSGTNETATIAVERYTHDLDIRFVGSGVLRDVSIERHP